MANQHSTAGRQQTAGQVRIIGGEWRGRKLPVVDAPGLRPTGDRIRETLFNWLQSDLAGSDCLDVFAGSGVLGAEALSRGAASVVSIEKQAKLLKLLQQVLQPLAGARLQLVQADALVWLNQPAARQFDLVFVDPPFALQLQQQVVDLLVRHQWLKPSARIYVERPQDSQPLQLPSGWCLLREKRAGAVSYALYQATDSDSIS